LYIVEEKKNEKGIKKKEKKSQAWIKFRVAFWIDKKIIITDWGVFHRQSINSQVI
jgi:hypothetical protein